MARRRNNSTHVIFDNGFVTVRAYKDNPDFGDLFLSFSQNDVNPNNAHPIGYIGSNFSVFEP